MERRETAEIEKQRSNDVSIRMVNKVEILRVFVRKLRKRIFLNYTVSGKRSIERVHG